MFVEMHPCGSVTLNLIIDSLVTKSMGVILLKACLDPDTCLIHVLIYMNPKWDLLSVVKKKMSCLSTYTIKENSHTVRGLPNARQLQRKMAL